MEMFNHIGSFLWAVCTNWAGYSTEGIIVALVAFWHSLRNKPVSRWLAITLALLFLFVAFLKAWDDQYHAALDAQRKEKEAELKFETLTKPQFEIDTPSVIIGVGSRTINGHKIPINTISFKMSVLNHGAPSVIRSWKCFLQSKEGVVVEGIEMEDDKMHLMVNGPYGEVPISTNPSFLKTWSVTPIPTGGRGVGFLAFQFPAGTKEKMYAPGGQVILKLWDMANVEYTVNVPWDPPPPGDIKYDYSPPGMDVGSSTPAH